MKAKSDAKKILSGKKALDVSRAIAVARQLEKVSAATDPQASELHNRLVHHLILQASSSIHVALSSEASAAVEVRARPESVPCTLATSGLNEQAVTHLQEVLGLDIAESVPAVDGLDIGDIEPTRRPMLLAMTADELRALRTSKCDGQSWAEAADAGRAAVVVGGGGDADIDALATVLLHGLADHAAAESLLASPGALQGGGVNRTRLRLEALSGLGQWADARALLEQCPPLVDDALGRDWLSIGRVYLESGELLRAVEAWGRGAQSKAPERALEVLASRIRRTDAAAPSAARAHEALVANDLDAAAFWVDTARGVGLELDALDGAASALASRRAELEASAARKALALATAEGDQSAMTLAAERLRATGQMAAGEAAELDELLAGVETQVRRDQLAEHWARFGDDESTGPDLVQAMARAHTAGVDVASVLTARDSRQRAVVEWWAALGHGSPDAVSLRSVFRLVDAEAALATRDFEGAQAHLSLAEAKLRGWERFDSAWSQATSGVAEQREEARRRALSEADRLESAGDLVGAVEALASVADSAAGDDPVAVRLAELRGRADVDRRAREWAERAEGALEADDPLSVLKWAHGASPELRGGGSFRDALTRARLRAAEQYPFGSLAPAAPPPAPGAARELSSESAGDFFTTAKPKDIRVGLVRQSGDLMMLGPEGEFWLVDPRSLVTKVCLRLPEPARPTPGKDAIYAAGTDSGRTVVVVWRAESLELCVFGVEDGRAEIDALHSMTDALPRYRRDQLMARGFGFDPATESLLVLDTLRQGGGTQAKVTAFDLFDGRVRAAESYPVGLFQLIPLHGSTKHLVSRMPNSRQRRARSWFHVGTLDSKLRLAERWHLGSAEDETYAFRRAFQSPASERVYGEYWFIDPIQGKVAGDGRSIVALKADGAVFYQSRSPEAVFSKGYRASGSMHLAIDRNGHDRLLWPVLSEEGRGAVQVVAGRDMRPLKTIDFSSSEVVGAVRTDLAGRRAFALVFKKEEGGFRVVEVDPAE